MLPAVPTRGAGGEALRWAVVVAVVAAGGYLAVATSAFWLWVANSAFRGLREDRSIGLGLVCVLFIVVPIAGSVVGYRLGRADRSTRRGIGRAAATMLVLQSISFLCGVVLGGPF